MIISSSPVKSKLKGEAEEVTDTELSKGPPVIDRDDGLPRCLVCRTLILTRDVLGSSLGMFEASHLRLEATARNDEATKTTFIFCNHCRLNPALANKVSLKLQEILSDMDFKVIKGFHE